MLVNLAERLSAASEGRADAASARAAQPLMARLGHQEFSSCVAPHRRYAECAEVTALAVAARRLPLPESALPSEAAERRSAKFTNIGLAPNHRPQPAHDVLARQSELLDPADEDGPKCHGVRGERGRERFDLHRRLKLRHVIPAIPPRCRISACRPLG